jgi:hypothetical protein
MARSAAKMKSPFIKGSPAYCRKGMSRPLLALCVCVYPNGAPLHPVPFRLGRGPRVFPLLAPLPRPVAKTCRLWILRRNDCDCGGVGRKVFGGTPNTARGTHGLPGIVISGSSPPRRAQDKFLHGRAVPDSESGLPRIVALHAATM